MRTIINKLQSYWLADASFVTLLVMLLTAVFILPIIMELGGRGVLLFNILLLGVFFSGIFSTRSVGLIALSAILFGIHLVLRLIRFGENPYSFFILENVIAIANAHFIYFSLASLTTVGFGDIYAVNVLAKMLATFLSTLGMLFPAIIIARLVGLSFKPD